MCVFIIILLKIHFLSLLLLFVFGDRGTQSCVEGSRLTSTPVLCPRSGRPPGRELVAARIFVCPPPYLKNAPSSWTRAARLWVGLQADSVDWDPSPPWLEAAAGRPQRLSQFGGCRHFFFSGEDARSVNQQIWCIAPVNLVATHWRVWFYRGVLLIK